MTERTRLIHQMSDYTYGRNRSWQTKRQARLAVFTWIESWYNPLRRHSGMNYKSPNNFEKVLNDEEINSNQQTTKKTSHKKLRLSGKWDNFIIYR